MSFQRWVINGDLGGSGSPSILQYDWYVKSIFCYSKDTLHHSFPDLAQHPSLLFSFLFFNILDNRNYKIPNHPPDQLKRIVGPNSPIGPSMFKNLWKSPTGNRVLVLLQWQNGLNSKISFILVGWINLIFFKIIIFYQFY